MLLDDVVRFCDEKYSSYWKNCGCENGVCNHPSGECSGSCYNCLYHIHYPDRAPANAKTLYDCPKMIYHYVCQYSYLYTTELLCALRHGWSYIMNNPYHHILSLGCGGCADLMAFEQLQQEKRIEVPISYIGVDVNKLWQPVHSCIHKYFEGSGIKINTQYYDVFDIFNDTNVTNANIIIMSYLISSLYNTDQIQFVEELADNIVERILKKKKSNQPLLFIINDINSNRRGRDYFEDFEKAIRKSSLTIEKREYKYFDDGNLINPQRIGTPYDLKKVEYDIPKDIKQKYHAQASVQKTVQLLLGVR